MSDVSTRAGGIVEAAAGEDLVGRLRCVQDDDVLPTESERVYLAILASPFEELEFSVKTHLVGENKDHDTFGCGRSVGNWKRLPKIGMPLGPGGRGRRRGLRVAYTTKATMVSTVTMRRMVSKAMV